MRFVPLVLAALLFAPAHARAGSIVWMQFLNSTLTYGTGTTAVQEGYDGDSLSVGGFDTGPHFTISGDYRALTGPLMDLQYDPATATASYLYGGGTLDMNLTVYTHSGAVTGWYRAPIVSLLIEAEDGEEGSVLLHYVFGPGAFASDIARALGISAYSPGGTMDGDLVGRPGFAGDYTTPVRPAWDGVGWFEVIPEPPLGLLGLLGAAGTWVTRWRLRRR